MHILLTGANGQVGFELRRALAVLGQVKGIDVADCDLRDGAAIRRMVEASHPDVIVHPAAYTAVDKAESDRSDADAINAQAPRVLAEEAERVGALMVHFSTDYVFDGEKAGGYTEADTPNPQSVYGATKLAGDHAVLQSCTRHLILRTSWVVGAHGGNFAKTMLRLAAERDTLSVVADQSGAPTSAALLADLTAHLLRQWSAAPPSFPYGLYHVTNAGVTNWHQYASYVIERARAAGKPVRVAPGAIKAIATSDYPTAARRPRNSLLDTQKLRTTFGLHLPDWHVGLDHILDQIFDQTP
jgi:dTDP-4-dehydrorhamnose reductase